MQKRHYLTGAIEILAFVLLIVLIVLFSHLYDEFPYETGSGLWTDRTYFIIVFWLGMLTYGVLFVFKRFPRLIAFPVPITPENVAFQTQAARFMLSVTTLFAMCVFDIALYDLYIGAYSTEVVLHTLPIAACFIGIFVNLIIYFIVARARK